MLDIQIVGFQDDLENESYMFSCLNHKLNTTKLVVNNVKTYFRFWGWGTTSPDGKFALITFHMFCNSHITRLNKITLVSRPLITQFVVLPSFSSCTDTWLFRWSLWPLWKKPCRAQTKTFFVLYFVWLASWDPRRGKYPEGWRHPEGQCWHRNHPTWKDGERHWPEILQ